MPTSSIYSLLQTGMELCIYTQTWPDTRLLQPKSRPGSLACPALLGACGAAVVPVSCWLASGWSVLLLLLPCTAVTTASDLNCTWTDGVGAWQTASGDI